MTRPSETADRTTTDTRRGTGRESIPSGNARARPVQYRMSPLFDVHRKRRRRLDKRFDDELRSAGARGTLGPVTRSVPTARDHQRRTESTTEKQRLKFGSGFFGRPSSTGPKSVDGLKRPTDGEKNAAATTKKTVAATTKKTAKAAATTKKTAKAGPSTKATVKAAVNAEQTVFDEERECVAANDGRPCVCRMADLLERSVAAAATATADDGRVTVTCPSYRMVPATFVVDSMATDSGADDEDVNRTSTASAFRLTPKKKHDGANAPGATTTVGADVDLDAVVRYRLDRPPEEDNYIVQYGLVDSDIEVHCLINGYDRSYTIFTWTYKKEKRITNTTIVGEKTSNLLILRLDPAATNNYTCTPATGEIEHRKNGSSCTHHVIAIDTPMYEIRGTAFYKTNDGGCEPEIINAVQKLLPSFMRTVMCAETTAFGSYRYACNFYIETTTCSQEKKQLKIRYMVTLNNKCSYIKRLKTCKNALYYQKLLAGLTSVLAKNLDKALTVQIMSKFSLVDAYFEPDLRRIKATGTKSTTVSCGPGFGVREVFCAACPPHHYSPDRSTVCLKCDKGYHQPVAGSSKCVRRLNLLIQGGRMKQDMSPFILYVIIFVCIIICLIVILSFICYRTKGIEQIIEITRKKFSKKVKNYKKLSNDQDNTDGSNIGKVLKEKRKKKKGKLKSKIDITKPNISFDVVHKEIGKEIQRLQNSKQKEPS